MEKLFEKLSSYNLLNNLLPGVIVSTIIIKMMGYFSFEFNPIESLFLYYFVGMIISRISSLIVEPVCKHSFFGYCFVRYARYDLYLEAIKTDPSISILLETNNMYRTFLSGVLIILFFEIYSIVEIAGKTFFGEKLTLIIIIGMILVFAFSYRKQTSYIRKRVLKYTGNTIN